MGDCHSSDPGSKVGSTPTDSPGPGALTFPNNRAYAARELQQNRESRAIPPYWTGLQGTAQPAPTSPLVENSSLLVENKIEGFKHYLSAQGRRNSKQVLLCAKRYGHILQTGNASELLTISGFKRHHAMEALVALSKYLGCYDQWLEIKERYQLKWTTQDSLEIFNSLINSEKDFSSMMVWLRSVCSKIPDDYANILLYATLVGLRPNEVCQSISLIQTDFDNYLRRDTMVLEHYKYPAIFIRNSKKAFISIASNQIIQLAKDANNCGYNALRNYLKRRGLDMQMGYCRKIFGTYLRINGIEQEVIDLLQGRLPRTVFARHYFRPDFEQNCKRITEILKSLQQNILVDSNLRSAEKL